MSNSIDPDETAHNEPSHLDLCCLQKPIIIACGSERVKDKIPKLYVEILLLVRLILDETNRLRYTHFEQPVNYLCHHCSQVVKLNSHPFTNQYHHLRPLHLKYRL